MRKPQIILGIETSCDETACAIVQKDGDRVTILSNVVASSASLQAKFGGVIPEQAAREQLSSIIPVISEALSQANLICHPELVSGSTNKMLKQVQHDNKEIIKSINAIAVTQGPGLIGSLLIGVETAKTLATIWNKPLIPVNHLLGHFYANWVVQPSVVSHQSSDSLIADRSPRRPILKTEDYTPTFPCLGLLVSGGHTDLVLFSNHGKYKYLGGTRDDASGECFDKCARLLGLPYPGGPNLSKLAEEGNPKAFDLPRPMINSKDLDFSFSGLKTSISNIVYRISGNPKQKNSDDKRLTINDKQNLAASIEDAITDVLVEKTAVALQTHQVDQLIVAGGVAANQILTKKLRQILAEILPHAKIFIPPPSLCTDNAVSTATTAFFNYQPIDPLKLQANPNLSLS